MCSTWGVGLASAERPALRCPTPWKAVADSVASKKSVFSGAGQIAILKRLLHTGARFCSADDVDVVG